MSTENIAFFPWLVQWLEDWGILILAGAAFFAPYYVARLLEKRKVPRLHIEFKNEDSYCRHEKTKKSSRPYFCHFVVLNSGLSQADDCEAVLEKIWDSNGEKDHLKWPERESWIPINLKWAAEEKGLMRACFKTIYPGGRRYFCDIARVTEGAQGAFEVPWTFISQDIHLPPGKHKIQITVYSKNAAKVTKQFKVEWLEEWREKQEEMQERLKIEML